MRNVQNAKVPENSPGLVFDRSLCSHRTEAPILWARFL
jgi:hypothetical protein